MTQDEIRNTLIVLLEAINHASTTALRTDQALRDCGLAGYPEAVQKIRDREQQIADKQRESLGQNTVGHASIELADQLAKLLAKV